MCLLWKKFILHSDLPLWIISLNRLNWRMALLKVVFCLNRNSIGTPKTSSSTRLVTDIQLHLSHRTIKPLKLEVVLRYSVDTLALFLPLAIVNEARVRFQKRRKPRTVQRVSDESRLDPEHVQRTFCFNVSGMRKEIERIRRGTNGTALGAN